MSLGVTGRVSIAMAALTVSAMGCSGSSTTPMPDPFSASPPSAAAAIHVDLGKTAERWRTVTTFSYGPRRNQLGPPGGRAGVSGPHPAGGILAITPSSIAVVGNTVWVLDEVKHRAAHFTLQGRYLGAVAGLPNDARDLPRAISKVEDRSALDYSSHEATLHISMKAAWDRQFEFTGEHRLWVTVAQVQLFHQNTYLWLILSEPYRRHGPSGDFLLELDGQGSVVRLERVAITRDYATVYRPFYVASDGSVYQLFASNTRAELRVRP